MKKKKPLPQDIQALLRKHAGLEPSKLPSDNASTLELNSDEWQWIDAVYFADRHRDPTRLLELMRVPPAVLPYVMALFTKHIVRKRGRPSILPTQKTINYYVAEIEVRALVAAGQRVGDAAKTIAPQWGLTVKALTDYCRRHSGYSRTRRTSA